MSSESTVALRAILKDEITPAVKTVGDAIKAMGQTAVNATRPWDAEVDRLTASLEDNIIHLRAQKEILSDPVYRQTAAQAASLRNEINQMTKSLSQSDNVESDVFGNMRVRRETLVMAHEAMMGSYKRLAGSAMVFAEYAKMDWLENVTAMINPYTIAIAGIGVALVGTLHHYIELSEKAAETYHEMGEMGERVGLTAEQMEGLSYATIGTKVKTEDLARAISTFSVKLEQHRAQFAALGVTAQDPVKAFEQFIDAASRAGSESERNRILSEGLGKEWQHIAPVILQGGAAIEAAIQKGKLPPDVKKDFEDMIRYQKVIAQEEWEADRAASQHAASIALENEKMKAGLAIMRQKFGLVGGTVLYGLDVATSGMSEHKSKTFAETYAEEALKKQGSSEAKIKDSGSKIIALTEEQQKALGEADRESAKKNLALSIKLVRDEWDGKLAQFKAGSTEYRRVAAAEEAAIQAVRDSFAKKNKPKASKEEKEEDRNRKEIDAFVAANNAKVAAQKTYQATIDDLTRQNVSIEVATIQASTDQQIAALAAGYDKQRALKGATKAQIAALTRQEAAEEAEIQQKATDKILAIYRKADNDVLVQSAKNDAERQKRLVQVNKEIEEAQKKHDEDMKKLRDAETKRQATNADDFGEAWAAVFRETQSKSKSVWNQIAENMKSVMDTAVGSISSGFATMIVQGKSLRSTMASIGETIETEVISSIIKMGLQYVEETALRLTTSTAANAVALAEGTATATALAAAWAPAATAASIASFGAADAAGVAGMATAYAAGDAYAVGFAGGGVQFGSAYTGERGPEISTPTVPQRITQTSNSTVNNSYGGNTIINTGVSIERLALNWNRSGRRKSRGMMDTSR